MRGVSARIIEHLEKACDGQLYILEYRSLCVRYQGTPHPGDFTRHDHRGSTLIVVPQGEDPEEVANEYLEQFPLTWAGKTRYPEIRALHPVSCEIEHSVEPGNVPISSLD